MAQQCALGNTAQHFLVNDGKNASQFLPHVHVDVIPRYRGDGLGTVFRMMRHIVTLTLPRRETPKVRQRLNAGAQAIGAALAGIGQLSCPLTRTIPVRLANPACATGPE